MKKRFAAMILAFAMLLGISIPVMAASPEIRKAKYEGRGYVEVDFSTKVQYKNASVTVTDPEGNELPVRITEKDDDDITFRVNDLKPNTKYTFTVSGVRRGRSGAYGTVTGTFKTPGSELSVRKAKYDSKDGELELDFYGLVQYKNPRVVIKDAEGRIYSCRISEQDRDGMEIAVKGLASGKYTVKISGIRLRGDTAYTSITASFRVK